MYIRWWKSYKIWCKE